MNLPETIGRYQVKDRLGKGGMAEVYLAYDPGFNRDVAIKLLPEESLKSDESRARFERESQLIARLEHEAIAPVYDVGTHKGQPYLVMRLMPGGSLADRLEHGPMPLDEILPIMNRLAAALDKAHAAGVVHRDLKPGNILFDQDGLAYLADFGIAKDVQGDGTALTQTLAVVGTPAYMSPEQVSGEPLDGRSDVYSLGVILFEMLTGQRPFAADTPMSLGLKHVLEPVPNLLALKADLPFWLQPVVEKALHKQPEQRFQRATELAKALVQLSQKTVVGRVLSLPRRRWPWVAAAALAFLLLSLTVGAGLVLINNSPTSLTLTPTERVAAALSASSAPTHTNTPTLPQPSFTAPPDPTLPMGEPTTVRPTASSTQLASTAIITPISPGELISFTVSLTGSLSLTDTWLTLTPTTTLTLLPTPTPPGFITFASNRDTLLMPPEEQKYDIYLLDLATGNITRLTDSVRDNVEPTWSPDGTQIAFTSYRDKDGELYIFNLVSRVSVRYTFRLGYDGSPVWSPDSRQLAFVKEDQGTFQICYFTIADRTEQCPFSTFTPSYDPSWSPQGQQILFAHGFGALAEIYIANASGGGFIRLTENEAADLHPSWSPDGRKIAFVSDRDGNYEIYVMDVSGQHLVRLTDDPADDNMPVWSPDGEWILFISDRAGSYDLYKMRPDGSQLTRLTHDPGQEIQPAWWMEQ